MIANPLKGVYKNRFILGGTSNVKDLILSL